MRKNNERADYETAHRKFRYDPETGAFYWRVGHGPVRVGDRADTHRLCGYATVALGGRRHGAHRVAWLMMTGEWPSEMIDHANRVRDDNRFSNLRQASKSQNSANSVRNNRYGLRGVWPNDGSERWHAKISHGRKVRYLGSFLTKEEAHAAYANAAAEMHGEFAAGLQSKAGTKVNPLPARKASSGLMGVYRVSGCAGKWRACIVVSGKQIHLGTFNTPQDASAVREAKISEWRR